MLYKIVMHARVTEIDRANFLAMLIIYKKGLLVSETAPGMVSRAVCHPA